MKKDNLENKAVDKAPENKERGRKPKDMYICTDKYPGLPEGYKKKIGSKKIADEFIKKGYIKPC